MGSFSDPSQGGYDGSPTQDAHQGDTHCHRLLSRGDICVAPSVRRSLCSVQQRSMFRCPARWRCSDVLEVGKYGCWSGNQHDPHQGEERGDLFHASKWFFDDVCTGSACNHWREESDDRGIGKREIKKRIVHSKDSEEASEPTSHQKQAHAFSPKWEVLDVLGPHVGGRYGNGYAHSNEQDLAVWSGLDILPADLQFQGTV